RGLRVRSVSPSSASRARFFTGAILSLIFRVPTFLVWRGADGPVVRTAPASWCWASVDAGLNLVVTSRHALGAPFACRGVFVEPVDERVGDRLASPVHRLEREPAVVALRA